MFTTSGNYLTWNQFCSLRKGSNVFLNWTKRTLVKATHVRDQKGHRVIHLWLLLVNDGFIFDVTTTDEHDFQAYDCWIGKLNIEVLNEGDDFHEDSTDHSSGI